MTRFEFEVLEIPHRDGTYSSSVHINPKDLKLWCNKMGADGWDFCETNTGSILLFKRVLSEDAPGWLVPALPDLWAALKAAQSILDRLDALVKPCEVDAATLRGEA